MRRRAFLANGLALGCSLAASPLVTPMTFAAAPGDNRLVVVILRGAMDGLDAVRPIEDPLWRAARPSLAADAEASGWLGGGFALHPALAGLAPLWQAGELAAVHAVSTPYRDRRSHFDGQDILEAGIAGLGEGLRDGWLNRLLAQMPGAEAQTAYAVGLEQMLILSGEAPYSSWAPTARLDLAPEVRQLLERITDADPLFRNALIEAVGIATSVSRGDGEAPFKGSHAAMAAFAAQRLRGAARIASFSLPGWDTHARQASSLTVALSRLAEVIETLKSGLGPVWGQTAVVCITEFGRTFRENGSGGTDHGTGGAAFLAGGAIRGGRVYADWPGLGESALYGSRDLMPTRDVRAYLGWLLAGLFGASTSAVEGAIFAGLDLGADPGILA